MWLEGCHGRRTEVQCLPQSSFNTRYWSPRRVTEEAERKQKHRPDWGIIFAKQRIHVRSLDNHCAPITQPRQCVCPPSATFERTSSDKPPRRPAWDCFENVQNFTATMASMVMPEHQVYHPWMAKANGLLWAPNSDLASFIVARGRHKCRRFRAIKSQILTKSEQLNRGHIPNPYANIGPFWTNPKANSS